MEIYERKGLWRIRGKGRPYSTKAEAEKAAGIVSSKEPDWKLHIPEELPLPEVREYDSIEEAIAEED